jgi:hypothetical protein
MRGAADKHDPFLCVPECQLGVKTVATTWNLFTTGSDLTLLSPPLFTYKNISVNRTVYQRKLGH